ncbi:MAG: DUF3299 domain-containing protein [Ardenticatenaceae bacterium]|nr:DUF3299 domain-containing protein [Ardenticatenaceae bacterium]
MLFSDINYKRIKIGWILLGLVLVSCVSSEQSASQATATPIVAYGASLDEWEAAKQESASQPANDAASLPQVPADPIVTESTLTSPSEVAVTESGALTTAIPITVTQSDNSMSSVSADSGGGVETTAVTPTSKIELANSEIGEGYLELNWNDLIPSDFQPEAIMVRYQERLSQFEDGDPEAMDVYMEMQEEFNNAPRNEALNNMFIKLPGFIAPLEYVDGYVTEFLLVPYFGACIHVPPPPVNQTVLVKVAEGYGIRIEESFNPFWILGKLITEGTTTDLAEAGYYIEGAIVEPYVYSP